MSRVIAHPSSDTPSGNADSMFYITRGSGLQMDTIDSNPNTDIILLDIDGDQSGGGGQLTDRSNFSNWYTAPGVHTVALVRVVDGDSLTFDNWVVAGNGATATANMFQWTDGTDSGCRGCKLINSVFDQINTSGANDFLNATDSDNITVSTNTFLSSNPGGSYVETDSGSANALVINNNTDTGERALIFVLGAVAGRVVANNIGMTQDQPYQTDIGVMVGEPEGTSETVF